MEPGSGIDVYETVSVEPLLTCWWVGPVPDMADWGIQGVLQVVPKLQLGEAGSQSGWLRRSRYLETSVSLLIGEAGVQDVPGLVPGHC